MEKSNFEKLCNHINYKAYKGLTRDSFLSSIALGGASAIVESSNALLDKSLSGSALMFLAIFIILSASGGLSKTKDIVEIKELYNEFIENYVKLNKKLDFNNPAEMSAMFNFLLYNGYLSRDKKFQFSSKGVTDINAIDGTNILNGKGVCRHIAGMFTDVLNQSGVEASRLCVYSPVPEITVKVLEKPKYSLEELYDIARKRALDEDTYNLIMKLIKEFAVDKGHDIDLVFTQTDEKNPIKRMTGNHTISFATSDGVGYYLDPTLNGCYIKGESDKTLIDAYQFSLEARIAPSIIFNDADSFKKLRKGVVTLDTLSMEELGNLQRNARNICKENLDLFEQFYEENHELYEDISEKVLQLKR